MLLRSPLLSRLVQPASYLHCNQSPCNSFLDSLSVRSDFLWWRASEANLDLGTEDFISSFTGNGVETVTDIARAKRPNFKFDPGFRLGLSTVCPDCSGCRFKLDSFLH